MALAKGSHLGAYEVLAPIGAGGMGEVYRARDSKLDREVAIKVLPADLAKNPTALARFEREAKAIAALAHPNILAIYDFGQEQGLSFVAVELLEGETLRQRMGDTPLPQRKALDYAVQIANGLAAAHDKGIVHRDLKPENIFVTEDGRIKILDFGLAKQEKPVREDDSAPESETLARQTEPGAVMGTVGYMSPEQVRGHDADHRSDIFSFGTILYEMVSGQKTFHGDSAVETMNAILKHDPPELSRLKGDLSPALEQIVRRCLEKRPEERFQSARDLGFALEAVSGSTSGITLPATESPRRFPLVLAGVGALALLAAAVGLLRFFPPTDSPAGPKRIAVLPFENLGPPEEAYFAAGMTEEITSRLGVVSGLGVISRKSALQYEGSDKSTKQIGQELGVEYILEGTVRWQRDAEGAGRVRVTPQLIRVAEDTHVWAERYDRVLDDIFQVQSEIAEQVIDELGVTLLEPEREALEARPTENLEAYQAYLRGLDYIFGTDWWRQETARLGIEMFERAAELDPDFALAFANLSMAHTFFYLEAHDHTERRLAQAKEAVDRALELQPDLPQAHLALGHYYYHGYQDYERALNELSIASRALPRDSEILSTIGFVRRRQGRMGEGVQYQEKALELSPRDADQHVELALTLEVLGRHEEAQSHRDRSISLAPDQIGAYLDKAWGQLVWKGKAGIDDARAILDEMPSSDDPNVPWYRYEIETCARDYPAALEQLASIQTEVFQNQEDFLPTTLLSALTHELLSDDRRAREDFDRARIVLEKRLKETPNDPRLHGSLGIAYAGLGRKEDAIREGERAVELYPVSTDALTGPRHVLNLAVIHTMTGEYEAALDRIDYLLSIPFELSVPLLELDPRWDPLRDSPR